MKKFFSVLLVIVIICCLVGCGIFFYLDKEKEKDNNITTTTTTVELTTTTTQAKTITTEEAATIIKNEYGEADEATGNTMSYAYLAKVKDSFGNEYYAFRHSWLVDNSHMSFLQNIFISLDGKTIRTNSISSEITEGSVVEFEAE